MMRRIKALFDRLFHRSEAKVSSAPKGDFLLTNPITTDLSTYPYDARVAELSRLLGLTLSQTETFLELIGCPDFQTAKTEVEAWECAAAAYCAFANRLEMDFGAASARNDPQRVLDHLKDAISAARASEGKIRNIANKRAKALDARVVECVRAIHPE